MKLLVQRTGSKFSGAERYTATLLHGLKRYPTFSCTCITNNTELFESIRNDGITSVKIHPFIGEIGIKKELLKGIIVLPFFIIHYMLRIKQLEKSGKFDLIILESMTEKLFLSVILQLLSYTVIWVEMGPLFVSSRSKIIKLLYKYMSSAPSSILAVSNHTKNDLVFGGVDKNKISVIYIGVDTHVFSPKSAKQRKEFKLQGNIDTKKTVIGFFGTVCEEKGFIEFIKVSRKILETNKNVLFLIVGDGILLQWGKEQTKIHPNNYYFTGHVSNVSEYLGITDILIFPTHMEGLSMVLQEALATGVLIIASAKGGNMEIITDRVTGYLIKSNLPETITHLVLLVMNKKKQTRIMSQNARQDAMKRFDSNKNSSLFHAYFKRYGKNINNYPNI